MSELIQGVDVHAGYGLIDWRKAATEVKFAWIKNTTGNDGGSDYQHANNVRGCAENGIPFGRYHFGYPLPSGLGKPPGRSPHEQAIKAWRHNGEINDPLPHAIDMEWLAPQDFEKWGLTPRFISEWFQSYCEEY